ncbi:hypothetical protein JCM10213_004517 [Rhodosporidiobolus nylandii]
MARDRLAAIRARQALNDPTASPSAPQLASGHSRGRSDPYDDGAPQDFNPYSAGGGYEPNHGYGRRPSREEPHAPRPGWQTAPAEFSFGGGGGSSGHSRSHSAGYADGAYGSRSMTSIQTGHSRSSSTGTTASRRHLDQHHQYPVPPIPPNFDGPPVDFTTPPLATKSAYLHSPVEEAPPRDFDPNDDSAHYAMGYRAEYGTPPQQTRHESQYVPANPRQTRQRSVSGGQRTQGGARQTSLVPNLPVPRIPPTQSESYDYEDEASTVDLVERESYERRESAPKRGGPTVSKGQVPFEERGEFFQEISDLQQAVREANGAIQSIGDLHNRSLAMASAGDAQAIALNDQLAEKATATRTLLAQLKNRLHVLEQGNANLKAMIPLGQSLYGLSLQDVQVREQQISLLKERFRDAIQRYSEVERDNRAKQRAKLERQVKVVNPSMTPYEISEVVKQAEGGNGSMFSQALQTNGYRSQAARGALREAQNRAAELARIEQTLSELAQLFNDMAILVQSQDVAVVAIEKNAVETAGDMEKGLGEVKQAVVHARNARKYRWWCFGIILTIVAIVLIVVGVEVIAPAVRDNGSNRNNAADTQPATTPAPAPAPSANAAIAASVATNVQPVDSAAGTVSPTSAASSASSDA